jgi:hypothetical protein
MCAAIALKLCTWLYIYDLQIKMEDGWYRSIFGKVMPLERILSVFRTSFSLHLIFGTLLCHTQIQIKFEFDFSFPGFHLIFGTLLCHTKIQINFEFTCDPLMFYKVMALGHRKISRIISFPDFFFLSAHRYLFHIWYIALPYQNTVRSSFSLVSIN